MATGTTTSTPAKVATRRHLGWAPYALVAPSLIYLAVFFAMPMINAFGLAFQGDAGAAKDLIRYLTDPKQTATVARELGFFPPTAQQQLPAELDPGIKAEADAIQAQSTSQDKITSLLPVGLKDKGGAYDDVFRTTFTGIVLRRRDTKQTLAGKAKELQGCWTR